MPSSRSARINDVDDIAIVAVLRRAGFTESSHYGIAAMTGPAGDLIAEVGDSSARVYPRSAVKPAQATAMLAAGLPLQDPRLIALSSASHSGEPFHLEGVREILALAGLDEDALQCVRDLPYGEAAREEWLRLGLGPTRAAMNCSGKHAAMLATCVTNGWDTESYLRPGHPLQEQIRSTIAELSGFEPQDETVDGCGAPLWSVPLQGLARMMGRIAAAAEDSPAGRVRDAIRAHPEYLAGTGRDVTELIAGTPGLIAKDGAEAVGVVGLADGRGLAVKVLDGGQRARVVVITGALAAMGVESPAVTAQLSLPVLGGGEPVGEIRAVADWPAPLT